MAAATSGRSLEQTPTWAVAVVCFVLVLISIIIEHLIELVAKVNCVLVVYIVEGYLMKLFNRVFPTVFWVFFFLILAPIFFSQWLKKKHKRALYEALEKVKSGTSSCHILITLINQSLIEIIKLIRV